MPAATSLVGVRSTKFGFMSTSFYLRSRDHILLCGFDAAYIIQARLCEASCLCLMTKLVVLNNTGRMIEVFN